MVVGALRTFLQSVHETRRAEGVEELCRRPGLPDVRSAYRWHAEFGDRLVYFPNVALSAFGLIHLHVFIDEPTASSHVVAYAVRALWVVRTPGARSLYLHCIVPAEHLDLVRQEINMRHQRVTIITTRDAWQVLTAFHRDAPVAQRTDSRDLLERYPLLIPVIFEMTEGRHSYPAVWEAIHERLGERVWEYLPRFSRRLAHNGKQHVKQACELLSAAHLVQQYIVRFAPFTDATIELLLLVDAGTEDSLAFLSDAAAIEMYPSDDASLVHVHAPLSCLTMIFSATIALPIRACWFIDQTTNAREPLHARFAYETLFDPSTASWVRA